MFAVKFKFKNVQEWTYINTEVMASESEILQYNYEPPYYLCETLKEAHKAYLIAISRYNNYLKYIKIARMNSWNQFRTEAEVLPNYWREWK